MAPPRRAAPAEKASKLLQLNTRLSASLLQRLEAAASVFDRSRERIIADALEAWLDKLPAHDRQLIDAVVARRQKP